MNRTTAKTSDFYKGPITLKDMEDESEMLWFEVVSPGVRKEMAFMASVLVMTFVTCLIEWGG